MEGMQVQSPQNHPLMLLQTAVPLQIQRLLHMQKAGEFSFEDLKALAVRLDPILEKADSQLLYRGKETKPGEVAEAFNTLAETLAAMAICIPGGVPFMGVRYDAKLPYPHMISLA